MQIEEPVHPELIKAHLRIHYGSLEKFEKKKGLPSRAVSQVLTGKAGRSTAEAIADELRIPLHRVSTHYYKLATTVAYRRKASRAHRLNAEAQ